MAQLKDLLAEGQSVWLDYISRQLLRSGELKRLVEEDGIRGITSNPTIFEKAMTGSADYDDAFRELLAQDSQLEIGKLYEPLAIADIQRAADVLHPVYEQTGGGDGYVSLEVSPHLAHDTAATIAEARRLRGAVARENLMIKVPATPEGIPAIEQLIAEGVNVNITLMFSMAHYEAVARAYIKGLERSQDPSKIASVASFFVSRVDTMVDRALESLGTPEARALLGQIAIANSKMVYQRFEEIFQGEGFVALRQRGARVQRPLWASTGTKNPAYSDVLYVENLIGPETVNTLPIETLRAFQDHGRAPGPTIRDNLSDAAAALQRLEALGVELNAVAEKLQNDGVKAFAASFDHLMAALEGKRRSMTAVALNPQELLLGKLQNRVNRRLQQWEGQQFGKRLWGKDPSLWSSGPVAELTDRLGWLELPETMEAQAGALVALAEKVKSTGMRHVVLLGMGGSSLAPEVFQQTFGNNDGYPALLVLDSTHPAAIADIESRIDLGRTVFVVSSKSGTTTETNSFFFYFWDKLKQTKEPGEHFIAITDPGTPLETMARERRFRAAFAAPEEVGGRYSALTVFGLLPAALIGLDIREILKRARRMSDACAAAIPVGENPALILGAALGELALAKRDKVTFICSPSLAAFPAWVEQLIAESTGKNRKGIVPVATEDPGSPERYSADRVFVYLRSGAEANHDLDRETAALQANGHPVIRIDLADKFDLGQEFFRWEFAVAAAGAAIGIHPFNQPDVQLAKDLAKKAMDTRAKGKASGSKPKEEIPAVDFDMLRRAVTDWLRKKKAGDYVAMQAYVRPSPENTTALKRISSLLRERLGVATTFGFGPRFLHSTGQLHKGGPNSVLALQIVDEPADSLAVPETNYTFDALIQAQAIGDLAALKQRRRRVLRVNLGRDTTGGFNHLVQALQA
jgi:transaldolase/glucose-6-phosphate isomerase